MPEHKEPIANRLFEYIEAIKRNGGRTDDPDRVRTERRNGLAELAELEFLADAVQPIVAEKETKGYFSARSALDAAIRSTNNAAAPVPASGGSRRRTAWDRLSKYRVAAMVVLCLLACVASAYSLAQYLAAQQACYSNASETKTSVSSLPYLPARMSDEGERCQLPVSPSTSAKVKPKP